MRKYSRKQVNILLKRDSEVWLYSYTDLVTNLLAFFLMILAMYTASPVSASRIMESIAGVTGNGIGNFYLDHEFQNTVVEFLNDENFKDKIAIEKNIDGISLIFSGGLFFDTLSAELTPEAQIVLERLAPLFKRLPKGLRLDVSGHADKRPVRGSRYFPSNWELSAARAGAVVRYLANRGVDGQKLRAIGYAETKPVSKKWAQNRRVVIRVGRGIVR